MDNSSAMELRWFVNEIVSSVTFVRNVYVTYWGSGTKYSYDGRPMNSTEAKRMCRSHMRPSWCMYLHQGFLLFNMIELWFFWCRNRSLEDKIYWVDKKMIIGMEEWFVWINPLSLDSPLSTKVKNEEDVE